MKRKAIWKEKAGGRRKGRQRLAVWLMLAMLMQSLTGASYGAPPAGGEENAAYTPGVCPHHTQHTEGCRYKEEHPCSHVHSAECYEIYDEDDESAEIGGDGEAADVNEDGGSADVRAADATVSDADISDATPSDATPSNAENCTHIHDRDCGHAEAHACEYHCRICAGEELTLEEQAKAMEEQMKAQMEAQAQAMEAQAEAQAEAQVEAQMGAQRNTQPMAKRFGRSNRQTFTAPSRIQPFVIGSEAVLQELADKVNSGETWANGEITYAESSYVLTGDIRLTGDWTPIGTEEKPFTGTFDGGGYVVSDMTIHDTSLKDSGLFGYVKGGTVEDLGVKDADILAGSGAYNPSGNWDVSHAGAVAGALDGGTVRRCYSTGSVNAVTDTEWLTAGGIVGLAGRGSSVESCYSTGNVLASTAGGIVGIVENSDLENCYSTGKIEAYDVSGGGDLAGGLIGSIESTGEKKAQLTNGIALNPSVNGGFFAWRCCGFVVSTSSSDITLQKIYAFSDMKVNDRVVTNPTLLNNGADLVYDNDTETFSTPWADIFSNMSVWDIKPGKLPTLNGIGGQDGEIPPWIADEQKADLYIGSEAELIAFRDQVNGANGGEWNPFTGKIVRLTADITLNSDTEWVPIGGGEYTPDKKISRYFSGRFDGGGHTISGVRISEDRWYAGLFGVVWRGVIENLGVKDVDVRISGAESESNVGAIAGCINYDTVIRRCYSTGTITGGISAGGVVGEAGDSRIEDCYSTAEVKAGQNAGGVVGQFASDNSGDGSLKNCYSTGSVEGKGRIVVGHLIGDRNAGGIAGYMSDFKPHLAALNQSVKGNADHSHRIVGKLESDQTGAGDGAGSYAFSGMEVNGQTVTGGVGDENGADLTYDPGEKAFSPDWETIFDGVSAWDIEPGKLPTLKGIGGQDGEIPEWIWKEPEADLYIGSEAELIAFRDLVNGTGGKAPEKFEGKTVRLTADITLSSGLDWVPIGTGEKPFTGTFDGGGHVIRNVRINDEDGDNLGLFSSVLEGTIQNLGVENVQIRGRSGVGGLAGYVGVGTSISNCYSTGSVTGEAFVGGLVGMTYGMVQGAGASDIITIKNCWHAGTVEQAGTMEGVANPEIYKTAGGIAGAIYAGTGLEHCYSAENMVAGFTAGGIVGRNVLNDLAGGMNYNAALSMAVDGEENAGRIFGGLDNPSGESFCRENYAYSGMTVNGKTVTGDDGTGKNGRDAAARDIVMNETLFPDSDWIREDGYYPRLRGFGEKSKRPLDTWLKEQADGVIRMTLTPDSYKFPDARIGYGAQAAAEFEVKNTGRETIDSLTAEVTGQWTDGSAGTGTPYFVLAGAEALAGIDAGKTASFTVAPAAGLPEGNYRATVSVTGKYGLKAEAKVEFKVRRDSDGGSGTVTPPVYTYLNGEMPSSVGSGTWEKLPGGGWKFYKDGSAEAGTGKTESGYAAGVSGATGGPGTTGGAKYAVKEWLYIDGFWYLFGEDGRMVTGWACVNGVWYYLSTAEYAAAGVIESAAPRPKEGAMVTGWMCDPATGQWYWLDPSGAMATGWREIGGKRYYFNPESDGSRGKLMKEETAADAAVR